MIDSKINVQPFLLRYKLIKSVKWVDEVIYNYLTEFKAIFTACR